MKIEWRAYVVAFFITGAIFSIAIYVSNYFNERRIIEIKSIEEKISIDILSLETQFDLLGELSCKDIAENSVLSQELNSLARRLAFTEAQLGSDNEEVLKLKRSYTLLQIKDYLLMKKVAAKCGLKPVFIFYFYSNEGDCPDCEREGHVLTFLREQYPTLRVYAFDYHLDLSALKTLVAIQNVEPTLPALVINNKLYYGFQSIEAVEEILPELPRAEENGTEKN